MLGIKLPKTYEQRLDADKYVKELNENGIIARKTGKVTITAYYDGMKIELSFVSPSKCKYTCGDYSGTVLTIALKNKGRDPVSLVRRIAEVCKK